MFERVYIVVVKGRVPSSTSLAYSLLILCQDVSLSRVVRLVVELPYP